MYRKTKYKRTKYRKCCQMIGIQRKFGVFGTLCKCNIIKKADTKFLFKLLFLNFRETLISFLCI